MSLILKQEPANTISTPPAGKSTLFITDTSTMAVKNPSGDVTYFPTVQGSNTQVFFNDNGSINGNASLVFNKTTGTMTVANLSVTGTLNAGDISVSSIANGTSNVDIIGTSGNVTTSVGGVANVLVITSTGANITGTLSASGNITAPNFIGNIEGSANSATTAGTVTTAAQPNITSTGTLISLSVSGNINAGNVSATTFTGALTGLASSATVAASANSVAGANVSGTVSSATTAGTVTTAAQPNITSVGTLSSLSSSGNITGANLITGGNVQAENIVNPTGNTSIGMGNGSGILQLTTSGNSTQFLPSGQINLGGTSQIKGGTFTGSYITLGTSQTDIAQDRGGNVTVQVGTGGTIANTWTFAQNGSFTSPGAVSATGNVTGANLITGGIVSATGNVTASFFIGNGSQLTGLNTAGVSNGNSNVNIATTNGNVTIAAVGNTTMTITGTGANISGTLSVSGNANVGNIGATTGVFTTVAGSLSTASQPNITSVGTLTSVSVSGNATVGNISATNHTGTTVSVTGNVTGGNLTTGGILSVTGTGVSSIAGNLNMNTKNITSLATPVNSTDAATKQYVDDVAQGLNIHDSCNAATTGTLATISGGTVTYNNGTSGVGATLTTTGSYTTIDSVTLSNGMRILVKNEANAAHNGIYDRTSSTVLTRSADFNSVPEVEAGDFTFVTAGTTYDNTGWVQTSTVTTIGTDAIDFTQFSGAGTYQAGTGLTLTGSVFSVNVAQPTITSVGTLTSLSVSGNANVGNIGAAAGVFTTVSGNGSSLTSINGANVTGAVAFATTANAVAGANVSGTVSSATSATTAGTVTTAAQGNITSVGTLTGLGVNGTITGVNITANTGVFTGNGSALTALNASNVSTGTLAQARLANASVTLGSTALTLGSTVTTVAGLTSVTSTTFVGALTGAATSAGSATTAGTVTTAAQPNITSVGTLTSLSVSGQITNANITTGGSGTAGNLTGNWTLSAGSRLQATYADLAEKYVADATYAPGTVLVFGGDKEVTLANSFDSTRVAGVVTTNPAYVMNSACEGEHVVNIALQGRAPVKVTGPVYKGDLLVSGINGHATANNIARAGTIIGKSLENFNGESGIIEVAVGRF